MKKRFKDKINIYEVDVRRQGDILTVQTDDRTLEINVNERQPAEFLLSIGNKVIQAYAVRQKDKVFVQIGGRNWIFEDITLQDDVSTGGIGSGGSEVLAPMPGSVIKVLVREGDIVKHNQPLIIVEAMKMENEVYAPIDAVVEKVLVESGQQVTGGQELIKLAPVKDADESEKSVS